MIHFEVGGRAHLWHVRGVGGQRVLASRLSGARLRALPTPAFAVCALAAATITLHPKLAYAGPCPLVELRDEPIADVDVETRLRLLARVIDDEVRAVDRWSIGWGSGYAAVSALQVAAIPVIHDPGMRRGLIVDAAGAGFGSMTYYLLPVQITVPLRAVRKQWSEPNRCAVLAAAERELSKQVKLERLARTPLTQIFNAAVNVGLSLAMGLGYGQWRTAGISFAVGIASGEAAAFTQPLELYQAEQRYRTGQLGERGAAKATGMSWGLGPISVVGGAGAGVKVVFREPG